MHAKTVPESKQGQVTIDSGDFYMLTYNLGNEDHYYYPADRIFDYVLLLFFYLVLFIQVSLWKGLNDKRNPVI